MTEGEEGGRTDVFEGVGFRLGGRGGGGCG